jgi:dipeptide/tripeptide permease
MSFLIIWSVLKIIQLLVDGRFRLKKLSVIALILGLLGSICRFLYCLMTFVSPKSLTSSAYDGDARSFIMVVLVDFAMVFWMAATSIILGFWVDVLEKKLRPKMAKRTKIICIIGACLLLLCVPGLIISFRLDLRTLGSLLVFLPLIVDIIGVLVLLLIIRFMKSSKNTSEPNLKKKNYAVKVLSISVAFWILYLIAVGCYALVVSGTPRAVYYIFPAVIFDAAAEFLIGLCILFLVDKQGGVIRLFKRIFFGEAMPKNLTTTGGLSTTHNGSTRSDSYDTQTHPHTQSTTSSASEHVEQ